MSEISNKLTLIRSTIRKEQLQTYMQSSRERAMRQNDEAVLRQIARTPNQELTREQLETLIQLANEDLPHALIMVGNLVIDRFLGPGELQAVEWKVGDSEYWPWVIHTFAEVGFCSGEMYDHCVRRIIARRSSLSLEHALEVLLIGFKLTPQAIETLKQNQELILALSNRVLENEERSPQLALSIFSTLTSEDEQLPCLIVECLGVARTEQMLLQGLMKTQAGLRALACQIANNFLMSGVWLQRVCLQLLEVALGEKQKVRVEVSYYLKALVEVLPEGHLLLAIKRTKLMEVLKNYSNTPHSKLGSEIADNALKALSNIRTRFGSSCTPEREMAVLRAQKLLDESEMQTLYEEESARMIE